jgi:octaprenyl-diphosphate synthase
MSLAKSNESLPGGNLVQSQLEEVTGYVREQLRSEDVQIDRLLNPLSERPGKMFRPRLLLLSGMAAGRLEDLHIKIAAITELIHIATLIHDDVIDEAKIRRGADTLNKLTDNETAVLLGDLILSKIFQLCAQLQRPDIEKMLGQITQQICTGELRQNLNRENWEMSESDYVEIIAGKTGSLMAGCCYLGGYIARAEESVTDALKGFGENLGIAFQITDDILDLKGSECAIGKTLGTDLQKNKPTLPMIHLLNSQIVSPEEVTQIQGKRELVELMERAGSIEYAQQQGRWYCEWAIGSLEGLERTDAVAELVNLCRFAVERRL